ncbi:unnamed protein product [Meloidogyne enterolobii]|uniref:Uncharacterized protein n=1 Tax=Meloidogyne enterolobii TaxID=390850 RepID=A0ACB0YI69_MELEN
MDTINQLQLPHPIIIMDIKVPHLVENLRHQRKLNLLLKSQQKHQRKSLEMKVVRTLTRVGREKVQKKGLEKEEVQMKEQEGVQKKEQEEVKKKGQMKVRMRVQRKDQMQDKKRTVVRKTMKMM